MNDTDLAAAYERLADAATPPPDARDRVAARITRRRRRRASAYAALAVLVVVGAGGVAAGLLSDDSDTTPSAGPMSPSPEDPTPWPFTTEQGLECPTDMVSMSSEDSTGFGEATFTAMLRRLSTWRGPYLVDRPQRRVFFTRDDGSVHTTTSWGRTGRGRWLSGRDFACTDAAQWRDRDPAADAEPLTLEVGHCWIEPVKFDGSTWDVMAEDQFGWGGGHPRDFVGTGLAWRAGDVVSYQDESGRLLTLVPADDPWVLSRGGCD